MVPLLRRQRQRIISLQGHFMIKVEGGVMRSGLLPYGKTPLWLETSPLQLLGLCVCILVPMPWGLGPVPPMCQHASALFHWATVHQAFCCDSKFVHASLCAVRPGEKRKHEVEWSVWGAEKASDILVGSHVCGACQNFWGALIFRL